MAMLGPDPSKPEARLPDSPTSDLARFVFPHFRSSDLALYEKQIEELRAEPKIARWEEIAAVRSIQQLHALYSKHVSFGDWETLEKLVVVDWINWQKIEQIKVLQSSEPLLSFQHLSRKHSTHTLKLFGITHSADHDIKYLKLIFKTISESGHWICEQNLSKGFLAETAKKRGLPLLAKLPEMLDHRAFGFQQAAADFTRLMIDELKHPLPPVNLEECEAKKIISSFQVGLDQLSIHLPPSLRSSLPNPAMILIQLARGDELLYSQARSGYMAEFLRTVLSYQHVNFLCGLEHQDEILLFLDTNLCPDDVRRRAVRDAKAYLRGPAAYKEHIELTYRLEDAWSGIFSAVYMMTYNFYDLVKYVLYKSVQSVQERIGKVKKLTP